MKRADEWAGAASYYLPGRDWNRDPLWFFWELEEVDTAASAIGPARQERWSRFPDGTVAPIAKALSSGRIDLHQLSFGESIGPSGVPRFRGNELISVDILSAIFLEQQPWRWAYAGE